MDNSVPSHESIFYVNQTGISGITDISLSYGVSRAPINILGIGHLQPILSDSIQGQISFSREYIYDDPILSLTGDQAINGSLIYASDLSEENGRVFGFTSGYLTSYSISCSVNDTPRTQCSFVVFGKMGSGIRGGELDYSGANNTTVVGFANQGSISLNLNQSGTNRIISFNQQYNIPRTPIYTLTQKTSENLYAPNQVVRTAPIERTTNFVVEVDDYDTANMIDNTRSGVYQEIGIRIKNAQNYWDNSNTLIYNFPAQQSNLIAESIDTSVDESLAVSLSFKDYIT